MFCTLAAQEINGIGHQLVIGIKICDIVTCCTIQCRAAGLGRASVLLMDNLDSGIPCCHPICEGWCLVS